MLAASVVVMARTGNALATCAVFDHKSDRVLARACSRLTEEFDKQDLSEENATIAQSGVYCVAIIVLSPVAFETQIPAINDQKREGIIGQDAVR